MSKLSKIILTLSVTLTALALPLFASAQGVADMESEVEIIRARVTEVLEEETRRVEGTGVVSVYQTLEVELLEGKRRGELVVFSSDFLVLQGGDRVFLRHMTDPISGEDIFTVSSIDRRAVMLAFLGLFVAVILIFSGKQGVRSLLSLIGSFFVILYILVPSLVAGYPPVLTSIALAAVILFIAIFFTHGFNRESLVAFTGTVAAVVLTGVLAYLGVKFARLSGFESDEAVYLNFSTGGVLNFSGILLGGIMIGVLGVLDDIAVTQAAVVNELKGADKSISKREVYARALRVGREHVGALVNTLALAYTGASLPLLLLFSLSEHSTSSVINQEVFATEIIRTIVGSIGLVLAVPITTLLAVHFLKGSKSGNSHSHAHHHH